MGKVSDNAGIVCGIVSVVCDIRSIFHRRRYRSLWCHESIRVYSEYRDYSNIVSLVSGVITVVSHVVSIHRIMNIVSDLTSTVRGIASIFGQYRECSEARYLSAKLHPFRRFCVTV